MCRYVNGVVFVFFVVIFEYDIGCVFIWGEVLVVFFEEIFGVVGLYFGFCVVC